MAREAEANVTDLEQIIRSIVREELGKKAPANDTPDRLTVTEYARRWSISETTVRHAIRDKRLVCIRIGRAVRIPADAQVGPPVKTHAERARRKLLAVK